MITGNSNISTIHHINKPLINIKITKYHNGYYSGSIKIDFAKQKEKEFYRKINKMLGGL